MSEYLSRLRLSIMPLSSPPLPMSDGALHSFEAAAGFRIKFLHPLISLTSREKQIYLSVMLMNIDLRQLRAFAEVVQAGSFSRAARKLGVSQSALSQAVRQLEDELQVRLLDRTTRSVQLSKVGAEFLPGIQRLLADLDHQIQDLRDLREHRRGHVTVACVPSVALRLMPVC